MADIPKTYSFEEGATFFQGMEFPTGNNGLIPSMNSPQVLSGALGKEMESKAKQFMENANEVTICTYEGTFSVF